MNRVSRQRRRRIAAIPAGVVQPSAAEVARYLRKHIGLAAVIPALCRAARKEFGPDAELCLQINHDPEFIDPYLVLYVRLPQYRADMMHRRPKIESTRVEETIGTSRLGLAAQR